MYVSDADAKIPPALNVLLQALSALWISSKVILTFTAVIAGKPHSYQPEKEIDRQDLTCSNKLWPRRE